MDLNRPISIDSHSGGGLSWETLIDRDYTLTAVNNEVGDGTLCIPRNIYRYSILLSVIQMLTFLFLNRFLCCDHLLELSRRDDSNGWSQHMICLSSKEISKKKLTVYKIICSPASQNSRYQFLHCTL